MKLKDYITEKPVLHTPRLSLRKLRAEDADNLREWMPNEALYTYWGKRPGRADKEPSLLFAGEDKPTKSFHWGIARRDDDRVIGEMWVYLIENDRMAKLAYRIAEQAQGQGYASEALREAVRFCFECTELQRLWTDVDVRNLASCRVLEKNGFVREGTVRQGKLVSSWCDYHLYALLLEDYRQSCKRC